MKKIFLLFFISLLFVSLYAQSSDNTITQTTKTPAETIGGISQHETRAVGSLCGLVTSGGLPLENVNVILVDTLLTFITGPDGTYCFSDIYTGSYQVSYSKQGYITQTALAEVVENDTTFVDINLESIRVNITGFVVGNDDPLTGLSNAVVEFLGTENYSTVTDQGLFCINNVLSEQLYNYSISKGGYQILAGDVYADSVDLDMGTVVLDRITAGFAADSLYGDVPFTVNFSDQSSSGVVSWLWDFGDGTTSTEQNPAHIYTEDGVYTVSLSVTADTYTVTETKLNYIQAISNPLLNVSQITGCDFGNIYTGDISQEFNINLSNTGTGFLTIAAMMWSNGTDQFYANDDNPSDAIPNGSSKTITVSFRPLQQGSYTDSLIIYNNSTNYPRLAIPFQGFAALLVLVPPAQLTIVKTTNSVELNWLPVTNAASYRIEYSQFSESGYELLGYSTSPQFSANLTDAQRMFYRVFAIGNLNGSAPVPVQINPDAEEVDTEAQAGITAIDENSITFSVTSRPNYYVGQILVSQPFDLAPYGFFRRVTAVIHNRENVILQTEPATIEDIVQEGDIPIQHTLSTDPEGTRVTAFNQTYGVSFNPVSTTSIEINGECTLLPSLHMAMQYRLGTGLTYFDFNLSLNSSAALNSTISGSGSGGFEMTLLNFEYPPFIISIGGIPIMINPNLKLKAWSELSGSFELSAGIGASGSMIGGIRYENEVWRSYSSKQISFTQTNSIDGAMEVSIFVGPQLSFKVYDILGPFISFKQGCTFKADTNAVPLWQFLGRLKCDVGLAVQNPITRRGLGQSVVNLIDYKVVLAQGSTGTVAQPVISVPSGNYNTDQLVSLSCSTPGAIIYYTTNGSIPTQYSPRYFSPLNIGVNTTLKARALKAGMYDSEITTATYGFVVATPVINPAGGTYSTPQTVTISCATIGAIIRYTTNGTDPNPSSTPYSGPIDVSSNTTLKARAFRSGMTASNIATATYIFNLPGNLVYVTGGTFTMGNTLGGGYSNELPTHTVTLSPFYIGMYEVTQSEWQSIMGSNPASGYGVGPSYPVYYVSWYAIIKYCNLRSMNEGLTPVYTISGSTNPNNWGAVPTSNNAAWNAAICNWSANGYRLPTEAEWEYAARGGTTTPDYLYSGSDDINAVAWYSGNNTPYGSKPVGGKAANGLGIYDMSGNVWEWCWDWYNISYYSVSPINNPTGPGSGSYRLLRGGNWTYDALYCRVSFRGGNSPSYGYGGYGVIGFRIVRANF